MQKLSENRPGIPPGVPELSPDQDLEWYSEGDACRHGQARNFNRSFLCANKLSADSVLKRAG
jgi:hypothetical protein